MVGEIAYELRRHASAIARTRYTQESRIRKIKNKGAYTSRISQRVYNNLLEHYVNENDKIIDEQMKKISIARAEIEDLKNIEMHLLGLLLPDGE